MPQINITSYKEDDAFRSLDWDFGEMLARRGGVSEEDTPAVTLLGAKCLQAVENGHSCLDLSDWVPAADQPETDHISDYSPLTCDEWKKLLEQISKQTTNTVPIVSDNPESFTPLYLDREHNLLYLRKYYLAEVRIAKAVLSRMNKETGIEYNGELKKQIHGISSLFMDKPFDKDLQQQAIAMALTHSFSILTGGPGTGKTTTLASFLVLALEKEPNLRIALAAPTGKAAIQMKDSLLNELRTNLQDVSTEIRKKVSSLPFSTLHRLLGIGIDSAKPWFCHNEVLPYDLIVVDEVSMASLKLLDYLFDALAEDCRILLIGDQYQLASVESGSVLGDFCSKCQKLRSKDGDTPDQVHITRLWENHRADIRALKDFLHKMNNSEVQEQKLSLEMKPLIDELYEKKNLNFAACELVLPKSIAKQKEFLQKELEKQVDSMLKKMTLPGDFSEYFGKEETANISFSIEEWRKLSVVRGDILTDKKVQLPLALAYLYMNSFRAICAVHDGLWGERTINRMMGELLQKTNGASGTPVIILKNDQETKLYNGDTGIFWNHRIYFPEWKVNENDIPYFACSRSFLPGQISDFSSAYAMTIHKSQGSGYDNVLMILPDHDSRIVTRELIYTGISRTKKNFMMWGNRSVLEAGIDHPTIRWSGLPYHFEK